MGRLVLGRRPGEDVLLYVGQTVITVGVVRIDEHKMRLTFEAPPDVTILRRELTSPNGVDPSSAPTDADPAETAA